MEFQNLSRMANRAVIANRALRRGNVATAGRVLEPYVKNNTKNIPIQHLTSANLYPAENNNSFSNTEGNNNDDESNANTDPRSLRSNSNASVSANENYSGLTPNLAKYLRSKGMTKAQHLAFMNAAKARAEARKAMTKKSGVMGKIKRFFTRKGGKRRRTYRRRR